MSEQFIVAVMLDGTLNVDATGPFRSRAKADEVCQRINEAGSWTEDEDGPTVIAQVVPLKPAQRIIELAGRGNVPA